MTTQQFPLKLRRLITRHVRQGLNDTQLLTLINDELKSSKLSAFRTLEGKRLIKSEIAAFRLVYAARISKRLLAN